MLRTGLLVLLALALVQCNQAEGGGASSAALPAPSAVPTTSASAPPAPVIAIAATVDAAAAPPATSRAITWQLKVEPALTFKRSDLPRFKLWIVATNPTAKPEDTLRDGLDLLVNGESSMGFGLAFGNGARENGWSALPPGATLREARELGDALFTAPGTYELDLQQRGVSVAKVKVRVLP